MNEEQLRKIFLYNSYPDSEDNRERIFTWDDFKQAIADYETSKWHAAKEDFYFPVCDIKGCKKESACGGMYWRETGYWNLCHKHSQMHREGAPQPKMKKASIDRENSRDKETGFLPLHNK